FEVVRHHLLVEPASEAPSEELVLLVEQVAPHVRHVTGRLSCRSDGKPRPSVEAAAGSLGGMRRAETCAWCRFDSRDWTTADLVGTLTALGPWWRELTRWVDPHLLGLRPAATTWSALE